MTDERKKRILKQVEDMLNQPNVIVRLACSVKRTTQPGDTTESYEPGQGFKVHIEIPCEPHEHYTLD